VIRDDPLSGGIGNCLGTIYFDSFRKPEPCGNEFSSLNGFLFRFIDGPLEAVLRLAVPCLALELRARGFLVSYWEMEYFSTFLPVFGTGHELEVGSGLFCA
jgi:hypothetical protein